MSKTNWADAITWTTTDLTTEQIDEILGKGTVKKISGWANGSGFCAGRAASAWDANEREFFAAYRSLGALLKASETAWIDG